MRHAELLGAREPLMWRLVPALLREMGRAYPELPRAEALITETLKLEETRFRRTLARGLQILEDETAKLATGDRLDGGVAFRLYDTFGFPLDLTEDALRARGVSVDRQGFDTAMAGQKAAARAAWVGSGEVATEAVWFGLRERVGATDFLGYATTEAEGVVTALISGGVEVQSLTSGGEGFVVVNQTPFYAESGGQVGDTGVLKAGDMRATVLDTVKRVGDLFAHRVRVDSGTLTVGLALELAVDMARRAAIRANHSATHLLHEALRQALGDHVAQKGSSVGPDRLRFDFSHPKPVSTDELARVEDLANEVVVDNAPVTTTLMAVDDAIASGARALFGEKYGDEVRVVAMGPRAASGNAWSVELCGGTHAARTGDIGVVAVVSESAVASGVRRIEAVTGEAARRHFAETERRLKAAAALLRVSPSDVVERLATVLEERRRLERELAETRKRLALGGGGVSGAAEAGPVEIAGTKLVARRVEGVKPADLKGLVDDAKTQLGSGVVAVVGVGEDGRASAVIGVTEDLTGRFDAVALVRVASEALGGKGGGGRRDMAQAGGPDGARAEAALQAVARAIAEAA